ncbi:ribonuclease P protein component [cyanobacterium endosymbiont of Braarudosphaera bigelowii]|uniref:Ribonuclease P protein component n=1 Tax=cyanobacterium endosymbiont of Braarudosphaera bigelowii TaxID=1285375 RepID=A0ABN6JZA2_9CHRO|nr:ribonuclease P protein component [cyanobacterium endosymbiont of Braarudosphaera bigelowii]
MGLPKNNRLRHHKSFQSVYKKGERYYSSQLVMHSLFGINKNCQIIPTQFGISISQKISKKAIVRNYLKRQIKSVIRVFLPKIVSGYQIVIVVKKQIQGCQYSILLREIKELLINAKIVHGY